VKVVQRMLGHARPSMTLDVYADLIDDDLEAVAHRLDEMAQSASARILADPVRTDEVIAMPDVGTARR
jgi:integrase